MQNRPILTYERRGCTKRGVKPKHHGIIHEDGAEPRKLRGEPDMGFTPIRIKLDVATETLAVSSRVNYAKLITVEHNVKVFFIGRIAPGDFGKVEKAVDDCWSRKVRHSGLKEI